MILSPLWHPQVFWHVLGFQQGRVCPYIQATLIYAHLKRDNSQHHGHIYSDIQALQLTGDFRRMLVDSYENASGFLRVAPQFCYHCRPV